jgi:TPR repeat protein
VHLWRKAADQGNADAQTYLGNLYTKGQGVPQNYAKAINLYKKACAQGDAIAFNKMAILHAQGKGVPQNYIDAYSHWSVAATLNNESARKNLSKIKKMMTNEQIAEGQRQAKILWGKIAK